MNKKDLARRLARASHRSSAQAADELDALLHSIFKDLKRSTKNPGAVPAMVASMEPARMANDPQRGQ